jgi:hypothetical protein
MSSSSLSVLVTVENTEDDEKVVSVPEGSVMGDLYKVAAAFVLVHVSPWKESALTVDELLRMDHPYAGKLELRFLDVPIARGDASALPLHMVNQDFPVHIHLPIQMPEPPKPGAADRFFFHLKINDSSEESRARVVRHLRLPTKTLPATTHTVHEVVAAELARAGVYPAEVAHAPLTITFRSDVQGMTLGEVFAKGLVVAEVSVYKFLVLVTEGHEHRVLAMFPLMFDKLPTATNTEATPKLVADITMAVVLSAVADPALEASAPDAVAALHLVAAHRSRCRWYFRNYLDEAVPIDTVPGTRVVNCRTLTQVFASSRLELRCEL